MENIIKKENIKFNYKLYNLHKILEQNYNIIFVVDIFIYVFVFMISLISIINVFNTISTNIFLRKRELAMLLSIGMSDYSFKKMMIFESIFYTLKTLLFGISISGFLSLIIYKGFVNGGANINYHFPLKSIIISIIFIFLIVLLTMLYTINKIKKENIINALRDELN